MIINSINKINTVLELNFKSDFKQETLLLLKVSQLALFIKN